MAAAECGDPAAAGGMAAELFQLASLLVGSQGDALRLVEDALAGLSIDPCLDPAQARVETRRALVHTALTQMAVAHPAAFRAEDRQALGDGCVDVHSDLEASGLTQAELDRWITAETEPDGALRRSFRDWISELPPAERLIFVQRAVLGQGNEAAARLLQEVVAEHEGGWTAEAVAHTFRRALCSLASALAHTPADAPPQAV